MSRFFLFAFGAFACAVLLAACGGDDPPQQEAAAAAGQAAAAEQPAAAEPQAAVEPLSVVVSNGVIADWTRQIAGDSVELRVLAPPGADVHTLELSVDDVRAVAGADLVIMNGAALEASWQSVVEENAGRTLWLADAIEAAGLELAPFSSAMEHDDHGDEDDHGHDEDDHGDEEESGHDQDDHGDEEEPGHDEDDHGDEEDHDHEQDEHEDGEEHEQDGHEEDEEHEEHGDEEHEDEEHGDDEHAHGSEDPHFWFDLGLASAAVRAIADELSALRPDSADAFAARLDEYLSEMADADADAAELLAELSGGERLLVTFHDAFGYFARRYGLEVVGFVVEGPEEDVGAGRVAALIEEIEHEGAMRIYREPQFESALVESIAGQTGAEVAVIYSQPSGSVLTWTAMLVANARAVAGG